MVVGTMAAAHPTRGFVVPPALSAKTGSVNAARGLAGLAAVAARLAVSGTDEEQLASVVDAARTALEADECVLWAFTIGGLDRMAASGPTLTGADEVSVLLAAGESERDRLIVRQLSADDQRLGVMSIRVARALGAEDRTVIRAIGDMLVPWLAHAERTRQLEV
jgi:hypothetical protein